MLFCRFEATFDGELQDIGFLQILGEADPDPNAVDTIYKLFRNLYAPSPDEVESPDESDVSFWFTINGLREFYHDLCLTNDWLKERRWGLAAAVIRINPSEAAYIDSDQAAFSRTLLGGMVTFTPIEHIDEIELLFAEPLDID